MTYTFNKCLPLFSIYILIGKRNIYKFDTCFVINFISGINNKNNTQQHYS